MPTTRFNANSNNEIDSSLSQSHAKEELMVLTFKKSERF